MRTLSINPKLVKDNKTFTFKPVPTMYDGGFIDVFYNGDRIAILNGISSPLQWAAKNGSNIPNEVISELEKYASELVVRTAKMKTVILTSKENEIYQILKKEAQKYGDNGYEFIIKSYMYKPLQLSINQFKGYLSQLVQKGLIEKFEDCYFDFGVVELIPECHRYSECNYDFNIIIK